MPLGCWEPWTTCNPVLHARVVRVSGKGIFPKKQCITFLTFRKVEKPLHKTSAQAVSQNKMSWNQRNLTAGTCLLFEGGDEYNLYTVIEEGFPKLTTKGNQVVFNNWIRSTTMGFFFSSTKQNDCHYAFYRDRVLFSYSEA